MKIFDYFMAPKKCPQLGMQSYYSAVVVAHFRIVSGTSLIKSHPEVSMGSCIITKVFKVVTKCWNDSPIVVISVKEYKNAEA